MRLHALLLQLDPRADLSAISDVEITGVTEDSRLVRPGNLFVARDGVKTSGARFLADAHARGAAAAVVAARVSGVSLPQWIGPDDPGAASRLSHAFAGHPSRAMRVLGVTGTNGKTTTAYLLRHLLGTAGMSCGMIGTVEIDDGTSVRPAELTTPAAADIARYMAAMRDGGCRACAMEVSSHALDQQRAAAVEFAGAAFTNLTGDHLDYHHTMDAYAQAKARLFESLGEDAVAAVNGDDPYAARMVARCRARVVRFGLGPGNDYRAVDIAVSAKGSTFVLVTPDGSAPVYTRLIGRHNIENALTAAALAIEAMGLTVHQVAAGLADAAGAPGRLQTVDAGQNFTVLVDYAHTDDALENVLTALRPLTRGGKLRVLFGCGGDRDASKRPRMARVAQRLADAVYVTSDNPRTENPRSIIDQIVAGFALGKGLPHVEPDRRAAIRRMLADSRPGDVALLAGKGHENYQIIGEVKHHFDDVEEAVAALGALDKAPAGR